MSLITIGATSAIAVAVAKRFHYQGHNLLLLARNTEKIPDFLLIPRFDGQKIKTMRNLPRVVANTKPNKKVAVKIWREKRLITKRLTLGRLESAKDFKK